MMPPDADDDTAASGPGASARPPVNRAVVFATVGLALAMMSVDSTIVATALHALQTGLGASINLAGWTLTAYSFGFLLMLPVSGKLSERYGRRRVFVASVVAFTLASLLCGLATNIYALIALRVLQAAGGAGFTPSATGIIVDHFGDARDRAVSLFGSIFPIGAMIGPVFGGLIVTYWSWRWVFFVNVPLGLLLVVLALRSIPPDPERARPARAERLDLAGMALLGTSVLAAMLAINDLAESAGNPWAAAFLLPLALAVAAAAWFIAHIRRSPRPFIAPHLVYGSGFGAVNAVNAIFGGITMGASALVPLYAINRYGVDALSAGSLLAAKGLASMVLTLLATLAIRRTGYRLPIYVGGCLIAIGLVLLAVQPLGAIAPYAWLVGVAFIVGSGSGLINPASRNAGLQLAPENSSTLAALRTMFLQFGSIATISVITAVLAAVQNPGISQAWVYVMAALLLLFALPLIARVPEHHGAW